MAYFSGVSGNGSPYNFINRLHQFPNSGADLVLFQAEGNGYHLLSLGLPFYSGIVDKWNKEFLKKAIEISGVSTTGKFIVQ